MSLDVVLKRGKERHRELCSLSVERGQAAVAVVLQECIESVQTFSRTQSVCKRTERDACMAQMTHDPPSAFTSFENP